MHNLLKIQSCIQINCRQKVWVRSNMWSLTYQRFYSQVYSEIPRNSVGIPRNSVAICLKILYNSGGCSVLRNSVSAAFRGTEFCVLWISVIRNSIPRNSVQTEFRENGIPSKRQNSVKQNFVKIPIKRVLAKSMYIEFHNLFVNLWTTIIMQ